MPSAGRRFTTTLFDRLRVDLYPPGATAPCADCTNDFAADASSFEQKRASIGIASPVGALGYRARVRLFKRALSDASGESNPEATIDVTVALPAVKENGVTELTVQLLTDFVGRPVGSPSAPVVPLAGAPARSLVDTWVGAQRTDCQGDVPPGAVCVPGGAYWMGSPDVRAFSPGRYFSRPHLVVLSPFFMAGTEVTVNEFRAAGPAPLQLWGGRGSGDTRESCTFSATAGPSEELPVTCVSFSDAHAYCAALGGDLPTEAQFEYVASGRIGALFPWGQDEPSCTDAIYGRAGYGPFAQFAAPCKPLRPPGGPAPPGSGLRDRLALPGGTIVDLAGNVREWSRDLWNRVDEACWERLGALRDPRCATVSSSDGLLVTVRGGAWVQQPKEMESHVRSGVDPNTDNIETGFRCVWPSK